MQTERANCACGIFLDRKLYWDHTLSMKTAISLPDRLFDEAEKAAQAMGIPRSQLFARALEEFIDRHKKNNITERLNEVYSKNLNDEFYDITYAGIESLRSLTQNDTW